MRLLEFLALYEALDPELRRNRKQMIKHFLSLNYYSKWNAEHSMQVARLARDFGGKHLGYNINKILKAALTHDVGKTKVPKEVLHKAGKLEADERVIMNTHVEAAFDMLKTLTGEHAKLARQGAEHHHTPASEVDHLIGKELLTPEEGELVKIIMICDIFEALTSQSRPYKEPLTKYDALELMQSIQTLDHPLLKKFIEWQHREFANEYRMEYVERERQKLDARKTVS